MKDKIETTIAFYDERYSESTQNADMKPLYDQFEAYLPAGANVLDAGCGSGRDSKHFLEKGYQVTSFDASETMCACASKLTGQKVRKLTFQQIDYQDCFDGIWACASLLHVPAEETLSVLQKIAVALKSGGVLYASWKYGDSERVDHKTGRFFCDMTEETLQDLIRPENCGMQIEEYWFTNDVRAEFASQKWVNVVARK